MIDFIKNFIKEHPMITKEVIQLIYAPFLLFFLWNKLKNKNEDMKESDVFLVKGFNCGFDTNYSIYRFQFNIFFLYIIQSLPTAQIYQRFNSGNSFRAIVVPIYPSGSGFFGMVIH